MFNPIEDGRVTRRTRPISPLSDLGGHNRGSAAKIVPYCYLCSTFLWMNLSMRWFSSLSFSISALANGRRQCQSHERERDRERERRKEGKKSFRSRKSSDARARLCPYWHWKPAMCSRQQQGRAISLKFSFLSLFLSFLLPYYSSFLSLSSLCAASTNDEDASALYRRPHARTADDEETPVPMKEASEPTEDLKRKAASSRQLSRGKEEEQSHTSLTAS